MSPTPAPRRTAAGVLALALLVARCAGPSGTGTDEAPSPGGSVPGHPAAAVRMEVGGPGFLNRNEDVAYVGPEACSTCHADIARTFAGTGMGRSWYPMSPDVVIEDFTDNNEFTDPKTGTRYRMVTREGRYYMRQFVPDTAGGEFQVDEREIMQVVGSGNHSRLYVTIRDGAFYQMPIAWFSEARRWDLAPGFEHNNLFFTREITQECTFCHNATMVPVEGTRNAYQEPVPAGIDCERCHGPGTLHVEKWTSAAEVPAGEEIDLTIVNPRHLPIELRLQVCYQCHLGGSETAERIARDGRSRYGFRPGRPLLDVMVPMSYQEASAAAFNVTGQADRMILSKCFTESGGRLECLTCHNPHITIYRDDRPDDYFRKRCLSCHVEESCGAPAGERQAVSDDCVTCHMRRAEPSDHRFATFIDHWIRKDIRIDPQDTRDSFRFEPLMPGTEDLLAAGEVDFYRGRAGLLKSFQALDEVQQITLRYEADASFRAAIQAGLDTADAWFYLTKNLSTMRRWDEAEEACRTALRRDASHRDARFELGTILLARQKPAEAAEVFRGLLQDDPDDPAAVADLGRCELALGRPLDALRLFDRAAVLDPGRSTLHANRSAALAALGRTDDAVRAAGRAAALDPGNRLIWKYYAEILQQAGRSQASAEALRHFNVLSGSS